MRVIERCWLVVLVVLLSALAACRPADPGLELSAEEGPLQSPLAAFESPLAAPTTGPSPLQTPAVARPTPVQPPAVVTRDASAQPAAPAVRAGSIPLVILHTNDTWGYYDPCG
jgi:hypothetical protein